ncbi:MAG: glycoside hydrolase family 65 protein [SAR324 cluster bacterium]|uniref:Glycoside hydrolase family 65 protein n=1 Tax=SAR324 cluster bacterium TaxID=2024889 RepID=A0A7X9IKP9_9DELT|nr:glycoside hydrolase family 65 protein [SAR324 cluster bacterium]
MTLETENSTEVEVKTGIDADVRTNGYKHFAEISPFENSSKEFGIEVLSDVGDKISIQTRLSGSIKDWICETSAETVFSKGRIQIDAGEKLVVEKRSFVKTSRDLVSSSDNDLRDIEKLSFEELLGENNKVWEKRWEDSDVVLNGNNYAQRALRVSLYHLLRAHVPNDSRVAIDAKGYAGEAYWGRFFWDTEMYLLPFFTATAPEKARTLVDFRVQSLEGAKQNAKRYGYNGARYAWESDSQGIDCCPNWQYGDHEVHITADVVYGLSYFAHATGDLDYLKDKASEVILETAKYWMERIDINTKTKQPVLLGVMGPDEYKAISNNNFYTNLMVKFALETAASIAKEKKAPESEWRAYEKTAEMLPLLKREDGLYLQCEGFDDLAEPQFEVLWKDRSKPFAAQVSQERLYRSKCLKQADVLMAMYLFPSRFSNEELQKAWDYYLPYTTHDSSLSTAIHAILACRLGKMDESWKFWMTSCGIDLDGGAAEGIHIAGAGGNWLVVVFGYAGLLSPLESETLTFNPRIPEQLQSIEFPLCWRNAKVRGKMSKNIVRIENKGETEIDVTVWTKTKSIKGAEAISWEL